MRRLLAFVCCLLLASSLGFGALAHASEPVTCIEAPAGAEFHSEGDSDQVPADAGDAYPHHHGGCHGHHIGAPFPSTDVPRTLGEHQGAFGQVDAQLASIIAETALRPPQA